MNANIYSPGQERFKSFAPPVLDDIPLDDAPLGPGLDMAPAKAWRALSPEPVETSPALPIAQNDARRPSKQLKAQDNQAERTEAGKAANRRKSEGRAPERAAQPRSAGRRRPLSRFVDPEENPNFYLSLSDLMCLLVVFFVLIFSLTDKGDPAPATAAAPAPQPKQVVKAAMPLPPLRLAPDPFPHPEPVPAGVRLGMMSVASAGQSDPGLVAEPPRALGDRPASGPAFDSALFTLVASAAPVPATALPMGETTLDDMLSQVQGEAQAQAGASGMEVEKGDGKVVLRLPENITFDLAKAEIKPGMKETLGRLAGMLARHQEVPVIITGHTDDLPINTPAYSSNWELSSARASAVGRALMAQGLEESRLTIRGLADRQPRVPNDSESHRSQNRRVEIELRLQG